MSAAILFDIERDLIELSHEIGGWDDDAAEKLRAMARKIGAEAELTRLRARQEA